MTGDLDERSGAVVGTESALRAGGEGDFASKSARKGGPSRAWVGGINKGASFVTS
jgi:hypothetical protein